MWNKLAALHEILLSEKNGHIKNMDAITQNSGIVHKIQKEVKVISLLRLSSETGIGIVREGQQEVEVIKNAKLGVVLRA